MVVDEHHVVGLQSVGEQIGVAVIFILDFDDRIDPFSSNHFFDVFVATEGQVCGCRKQTDDHKADEGIGDDLVCCFTVFQ